MTFPSVFLLPVLSLFHTHRNNDANRTKETPYKPIICQEPAPTQKTNTVNIHLYTSSTSSNYSFAIAVPILLLTADFRIHLASPRQTRPQWPVEFHSQSGACTSSVAPPDHWVWPVWASWRTGRAAGPPWTSTQSSTGRGSAGPLRAPYTAPEGTLRLWLAFRV